MWRCKLLAVASGPAKKIFNQKCPELEHVDLSLALEESSMLLCGTGGTGFEFDAMSAGIKKGIKTIVYLDHWVNYRMRFQNKGKILFPDEIWVGDRDAFKIAKDQIDEAPIVLKDNPYFQDLIDRIGTMDCREKSAGLHRFLYVSEPIIEENDKRSYTIGAGQFDEHDALKFFLKNISLLSDKVGEVCIRPHPLEKPEKYFWVRNETQIRIKIENEEDLFDEIIASDFVVGCETTAMIIGLLAGKRVICSIPPGCRPCRLPQNKILSLSNLI